MIQEEKHEIKPLKKEHPILNSLVIKIVLTVMAILWNYLSLSPLEKKFVMGEDMVIRFVVAFILILLCLSFAEALGLWVFGLLKNLIIKLKSQNAFK